MEWLIPLQGQVVALDTAPLIYFIEQNEAYLENDAHLATVPGLDVLVLDTLQ
ncbi:hypothetical protein PN466_00145 [Roseofilum reptotaenium CS-1145]|nr:hypothetical protein [Roseofilum reptotaenium]MDB9515375.1 hypothetical protein [Roseofilum reptotaenium CS-1145]